MTGSELKTEAEKYLPVTIDNEIALQAINEAIDWIGDLATIVGEITITAVAGTFYSLPDDITRILRVEDRSDTDEPEYYRGWRTVNGDIQLADSGTYVIVARKMPDRLPDLSNDIGLHRSLQNAITKYIRAFAKLKEDENNPDGLRLKNEFERDVVVAAERLRSENRGPAQVDVVRHA